MYSKCQHHPMAGEVGCRLQTPVLLRLPVLKKIHSCHKHALSVYEGRCSTGRGDVADTEERTLPAFLQLGVQGAGPQKSSSSGNASYSWGSRSPHASRQLSAVCYLLMGEMAPPPPSSPVLECNPFAHWGFLVLIWIRSLKGSVEGGEVLDSGSEGQRDQESSVDPEKYSSYKSDVDTKQEMQTLSVSGKGWGPKTATKKLRITVQISSRAHQPCLPFFFFKSVGLLDDLFPLSWFRAASARSSRAGPCPGPAFPTAVLPRPPWPPWEPQPKGQGLLTNVQ